MAKEPKTIFEAAATNDVRALEAFLQSGISVNCQDEFGLTPLHYAATSRAEASLTFLMEQKDLNGTIRDNFDRDAGWAAVMVLGPRIGFPIATRLAPLTHPENFVDCDSSDDDFDQFPSSDH